MTPLSCMHELILCISYICGLREKPEQVCNALGIDQDSLQASEDSTADPHEIKKTCIAEKRRGL